MFHWKFCLYAHITPYEKDSINLKEFRYQLTSIENVLDKYSDCHVVLGGDFNVDLVETGHTVMCYDFCEQAGLFPMTPHTLSTVDYTYDFNMRSFSTIDHFFLSVQLYRTSVKTLYALRENDNLSDNDPLHLQLELDISRLNVCHRVVEPKSSQVKAQDLHIVAYKILL